MASQFTHKRKLELLATAIRDNMPFVTASVQKFPQSEMKGRKLGAMVHMYLADPGKTYDGIIADPSEIYEVELVAYMQSKGTSVETDIWEVMVAKSYSVTHILQNQQSLQTAQFCLNFSFFKK